MIALAYKLIGGGALTSAGFRIVLVAAVAAVGIWKFQDFKASLRAEGEARCERRVAEATAELIKQHEDLEKALRARITALQNDLAEQANRLQAESVASLDEALLTQPDRPCLTEAVNKAIAKRVRRR